MDTTLTPVDGGYAAWGYLAAATCLETLVWGFANSYGVYLDYYQRKYDGALPIVGTVSTGIMYLLILPLQLVLTPRPELRPYTMWAGLVMTSAGLVGAAFAQSALGLIATQGIMFGIGGTMLYCPTTAYLFEHWVARRGFASGVLFSGTGVGGLVMPIVSAAMLERWGQKTTLVSIAIAFSILLGALIPLIRPRLPLRGRRRVKWAFCGESTFWTLSLGVGLQGLAAFMPGTYLPLYCSSLGLDASTGTLSVALMNLARVPGQILVGWASDRLSARHLILGMCAVSAATAFSWQAAVSAGGVLAFAMAFGAFAGSYTALFPRFIGLVACDDPHLPAVLYAMFSFARGVGSIVSGPLSAAILVKGYSALIVYTGVAMVGSGIGAAYVTPKA